MIGCPIKDQTWLDFVEKSGSEEKAYALWMENGFNIPTGPSRENDFVSDYVGNKYKAPSEELDNKIKDFLKTIGVKVDTVKAITDSEGNKLNASGVANLLTKSIEVVKGQATLDTLPEEASHFFIEILKQNNSPLYSSMFSEIETYDIYKETLDEYGKVYAGNIVKIKEEAMGKLIASLITQTFEQESKQNRVASWWNRVLAYLKGKLGLIDKQELEYAIIRDNPFSEAANAIYNNSPNYQFSKDFDSETYEQEEKAYYQLTDPKRIEDRIREKFNLSLGINGKYTRLVDGKPVEIKNRVSQKVQPEEREKTEAQKKKEQSQIAIGTKGHKDLDNIIQRLVAERDGKISPSRKIETDEATYNTLERYVTQMLSDLSADSRIITNTPIYDEKTDTGGTPNMLVLHPNGKVDILQWRFTSLTKDGKVNKFNETIWNKQLQEYKRILNTNYGIKEFGKVRTIPIETNFSKENIFSSIRTGDQSFENEALNPIPVSEEMTGDENLDRVLQKLVKDKNEWENKKSPSGSDAAKVREFNERKYSQIAKLTKAIRDIQLKQDIKQFVNIGLETITELANTPINQYSMEHLLDLEKTMQFYGKDMLALVSEQIKDFSDTDKAEFNRLVTESQLYDTNIKTEVAKRLIEVNGDDLLTPQTEGGIWSRMMQTVSQQSHPIIKSFWNLVKGAKAQTREQVVQLNEQIQEAIKGLKEVQSDKSGVALFDFMLKKKSNGQLSIISKYRQDFLDKLNESRSLLKAGSREDKVEALRYIKSNTTFDSEAYKKAEQEQENFLAEFYKLDEFADEKISDRIKDFRAKYSDTESGYSNPKNYFVKIKDDVGLQSQEYRNIQSKPQLKKFYDLWMKHSKEFQDYIGKDLGGNFVWNVHNGLVDSIAENGFGAFTNMNSILDHLEARPGESLGMIDPETGKPLYEIPAYYTDVNRVYNEKTSKWEVDSSNQSRDLGKVLSLVGAMAYNHKYMSDIESNAKALELLLQNQQSLLVDNNGNEVKNKLTGQLAKVLGSSDTMQQFNDYMNYYIYGVRSKTKDYVYKIGKRNYSALQTYNLTSKWFVGKALALNPQSIMANITGGNANVRIIGAMDKYFNNSEFNKAIYNFLPSRNKKAFTLMGYFNLVDGQNFRKGAESLSTNALSRILTYDNLLIGQESGDKIIRNGVLLAMLQSHTYKEGRIIKAAEGDVSLMDYIDTSKEQIDFKGIEPEALERFRTKVLAVTDNVLGNNSRDDIRLAQLTVMGRALLTFRSWIPRMVDTRFADLKHNEELDTYELGRYKTFWNQIVNKQLFPLLIDSIRGFGVFGYGGKFGDRTINKAKELYAEYMEKNPMSKMTEQEYIDLHLSNMRGNMMEIYITGIMLAAIMAASPDDGEKLEQGSLRKWFAMQMDRNLSELTFFYDPVQFNKIIKSPIPLVNTYLDIFNLGKAYVHGAEEIVTGSPVEGTKNNEFRKANFKVIPGLSGFESLYSFIDEDYEKSNSIGTDSRNR